MEKLRTQRMSSKFSDPLKFLLLRHYFISKKYHRILDYQCGRGDDVKLLVEDGYKVIGCDDSFKHGEIGEDDAFETVLCTYVLDHTQSDSTALDIIKQAWQHVAFGGILFVSTRTPEQAKCEDVVRGYTGQELIGFISDIEGQGYVEVCARTERFSYIIITKLAPAC